MQGNYRTFFRWRHELTVGLRPARWSRRHDGHDVYDRAHGLSQWSQRTLWTQRASSLEVLQRADGRPRYARFGRGM